MAGLYALIALAGVADVERGGDRVERGLPSTSVNKRTNTRISGTYDAIRAVNRPRERAL
jgi:hypothetical protein